MQTTENRPNVIDLNSFRQEREQAQAQAQAQAQPQTQTIPEGYTPALMWYPVWVLVPTPPQPPVSPA